MSRVVLVRHGETSLNAGGGSAERIRGWKDIPLDSEGEAQAKREAQFLSKYDVVEICSSTLARAMDTGQAIAEVAQVKVVPTTNLLPWNLGELQGELVSSVRDTMIWYQQHENNCPTRGEPFKTFRLRFLSYLMLKLEEATKLAPDDVVVLVTHSRNLQTVKAWEVAGFPADLYIDTDRMNDYSDETSTGERLTLKVT
jgi:probable phosphoglycerate mutase